MAETSAERLLADIFGVDLRELIVADPVFYDAALKPVFDVLGRVASPAPGSLFDSASAPGRIARFFDVATTDSFGSFSRAELSAIAGAIAYVEKTQKAERPPLSRPERETGGIIAVHRPGNAVQPRAAAHAERAAARARCSRRSTGH